MNARKAIIAAVLLALCTAPVSAQTETPPLQIAERWMMISDPDGNVTNFACIDTGMHPGQGIVGPGYDAVTYSTGVILELPIGQRNAPEGPRTATPNLEGLACRVLSEAPQ